MTDYQKIDWSKLPELPGGLTREQAFDGSPQIFKGSIENARLFGNGWSYYNHSRAELELDFAATDIIDRFITEQEAEQQKPKPRRVTPKELLIELIQTGKAARIPVETINGKPTPTHIRWTDAGLFGTWPNGSDGEVSIRWFLGHGILEVTDAPIDPFYAPRLPVKTKAPEGHAWELDRHRNVVLRKIGTESTWGLIECSAWDVYRENAIRQIAIVDASEELNP